MDEMIQKLEIVMSGQPMMVSSAFVIFLIGPVLPGLLLKMHNNYSNRKAIPALARVVESKRTLLINSVHALTIILPVLVLTYAFVLTVRTG